jgi:hypothetical protein
MVSIVAFTYVCTLSAPKSSFYFFPHYLSFPRSHPLCRTCSTLLFYDFVEERT